MDMLIYAHIQWFTIEFDHVASHMPWLAMGIGLPWGPPGTPSMTPWGPFGSICTLSEFQTNKSPFGSNLAILYHGYPFEKEDILNSKPHESTCGTLNY